MMMFHEVQPLVTEAFQLVATFHVAQPAYQNSRMRLPSMLNVVPTSTFLPAPLQFRDEEVNSKYCSDSGTSNVGTAITCDPIGHLESSYADQILIHQQNIWSISARVSGSIKRRDTDEGETWAASTAIAVNASRTLSQSACTFFFGAPFALSLLLWTCLLRPRMTPSYILQPFSQSSQYVDNSGSECFID
jgi:hypothetical protein